MIQPQLLKNNYDGRENHQVEEREKSSHELRVGEGEGGGERLKERERKKKGEKERKERKKKERKEKERGDRIKKGKEKENKKKESEHRPGAWLLYSECGRSVPMSTIGTDGY